MVVKLSGFDGDEHHLPIDISDIDMLGLAFAKKSKHCLKMIPSNAGIIPDYVNSRIFDDLPCDKVERKFVYVGEFDDDMPQDIVTRIVNYNIDYIQLNGEETPVMIENLRKTVVPDIHGDLKVIKKILVAGKNGFDCCKAYERIADFFLFDFGENKSIDTEEGRGKAINDILKWYDGHTPFLVNCNADGMRLYKEINHMMFRGLNIEFNI